ncbi:MAG: AgmX/PglI C-terminal domain-containing protein [Pseudomonadota bacterium]
MAALQIWIVLALAAPLAPDPADERASLVLERLVEGDPAAALEAVGDDEFRNQVVLKVRDRLRSEFETRDDETDQRLASTFANLVAFALDGPVSGQGQGEALMWSEVLWETYIGDLDDGHRVDLMLGAVLKAVGGLAPAARAAWARRVLDRTEIRGLSDAALGPRPDGEVPTWLSGQDWQLGGFLYGVMDAWIGADAGTVTTLTPLLESRLLLDRLLAIQGLKRLGTPAALAALEAQRGEEAGVGMYLEGHTVGSQASLALTAVGMADALGALRVDLVAAKMDVGALDRLRRDILTDLSRPEPEFRETYAAATAEMKQTWSRIEGSAGEVRRRWVGLLRGACRREVDAAPEVALLAGDAAWRGRIAEACIERLTRDAEISGGVGPVFSRIDALGAVGLALKARERIPQDRVTARARAYLRTVAEAAYDTARGREEIDGLTSWTMEAADTATVVRRILDVAFEQALADGQSVGPGPDGSPGLLRQELDGFREAGQPEDTVLALLIGLRWHLLWRDAGRDERSIHRETAWARFGENYWEQHRDLRERMRVDPYAREILEDLARDDEDVATLRWSLAPEDRPLLARIRTDLMRALAAAGTTAQRTAGVSDQALEIFLAHYPVLEEIAMTWLSSCFGERPATPAPAGLTPPKPREDPMDLRRAGQPASAFTDVVHENYQKFDDCYSERLKRRPGLKGTLIIEVKVSTQGKVAARVADDGLGDEEVATCVLRTMRRLEFPFPKEEVRVFRVPLEFSN